MNFIYLDNNSTTRTADEVVAAMQPYWTEQYGNASSLHLLGQAAKHAVETAREQVAALIGTRPRDIVFTSGGTESDNLAIVGTLAAHPHKRHIVTTAVEHVAVHGLCRRLEAEGYRVTFVGVDSGGHLDLNRFARALDGDTALASVMYANNETGVIFPISRIAEITARHGVPLHVDAVQAAGKINIDASSLGANLISISAHKIHGPKGVGALFVGRGARLRSQFVGGHQERDIRPGTENVAAIVGFGVAAERAKARLNNGIAGVAALRDRLEEGILARVDFGHVIGDRSARTPNTTNIGFERLSSEAILIALSESGICASSGSACSSGSLEPSHVLKAMGIDERIAHGAVRFSLSCETTEAEIDRVLEVLPQIVRRLALVGLSQSAQSVL
ncbi:MAG TPA: aminotransferase class V-fold PLP-dependent enzyme [Phycisphaerae bacterium]|nr:aminotransferase class V-fold PLP-dependent enzyme [Phycisphaerae bacterium]